MNDTAFDPARFKLPPEVADELAKAKPKQHNKKAKRTEPFLQISHKAIRAGAKVLGCHRLLVWLYIFHRVWSDNSNTVVIGNQTLRSWGVPRYAKYRALSQLAEAGLISVQWRERRSPVVTLIYK
jgi:hypothetical protein